MSKKCPASGIALKFAKMNPNKSSARYAKGIWHITKSTTSLSWKLSGDIVQFFLWQTHYGFCRHNSPWIPRSGVRNHPDVVPPLVSHHNFIFSYKHYHGIALRAVINKSWKFFTGTWWMLQNPSYIVIPQPDDTRYTAAVWRRWQASKQSMMGVSTPCAPRGCDNSDTFLWHLTHQLHAMLTIPLSFHSDMHTHSVPLHFSLPH